MATKRPRSSAKPTTSGNTDLPIRVREDSYRAIRRVADSYRGLSMRDAIDVIVEGWSKLTPEQQVECLRKS